jgi:hypothetical protein
MDRLHCVLPVIVLLVAGAVTGSAGVSIPDTSEWKYSKWNKFVNAAVAMVSPRAVTPHRAGGS